jgi:NADH:ubiquinone oxidoreductase subunit E
MCKKTNKISQVVMICNGSDCKKKGSKDLYKTCRQSLKDLGCAKQTLVVRTECTGLCKQAPLVCIGGTQVLAAATHKALRLGLETAFA